MSNVVHLRDAGDAGLLLQLPAVIDPLVNARVIAIAAFVRSQLLPGVRDVVSTFRSVAVYFDPLQSDTEQISDTLRRGATLAPVSAGGRHHEIAVVYGGEHGPDLVDVAARAGLTPDNVAERHAAIPYRVYMLGFQPGFAYLGLVDPIIAAPRRPTPRLRVPAGSVGIAGRQTGIYPADSPGGWQIVGRAIDPVFDPMTTPPALLAAGDSVVFRPAARDAAPTPITRPLTPHERPERCVTVVSPGLFTTIQDAGVWGQQGSGVPVSGAMDAVSHAIANALVGNPAEAATLEVTIVGPELRIEQDTTIAIAGADLSATLEGFPVPPHEPTRCQAGRVLRFGARRTGTRAYVAFDGGVRLNPRWPVMPLVAGQTLALGRSGPGNRFVTKSSPPLPVGGARLRVLAGPQAEELPEGTLEALCGARFTITPQSNRMGYRLSGAKVPASAGEMISDATFPGGVQIPPSGEPILLMADRQTTGGYPQIATVISADLPVAGQLAPGDWIEFIPCSRDEALAALAAQEAPARDAR